MSRTTAGQGPTPLLSLAGFRKFTPAEYHTMGEAGIIMEGEPFELLEGYVVEKGMRGPMHEGAVRRITKRLPKFVPADWVLQVQDAVAVVDSEPEPDAAIVRGD